MLQLLAGTGVGESEGSARFRRHRPEQTLLYRLIEQYYPVFELQWASEGRGLPDYVRREFDEYLSGDDCAHRLKRVFNIDVKTCRVCGAAARVMACIEDPRVISKILKPLQEKSPLNSGIRIAHPRAPPPASLFG